MTIQHSIITDPNVHEPKGISTALDKTSYHADGVGSGAWRKTMTTDLSGIVADPAIAGHLVVTDGLGGFSTSNGYAHGTMAITNNVANFSVTAASDSTFNTVGDFQLITGAGAPWTSENLHNTTFTTDRVTVLVSGIYEIGLWGNINGWPANNSTISFRYRISGGGFSSRKPTIKTNTTSDPRQINGFGLLQLNAGDYVQLYMASSHTGNVQINDANTTIRLVRPI